ncbi:MAG: TerB family tellurite resistance protein [Parvibaculum sp.]|nr:TerB family tellurite resistance protein [Parvibaculum sp.]|tara:strand:+ start:6627 stop:7067 length:441 start_codon:yes stop_codon:yes gene_type:complete
MLDKIIASLKVKAAGTPSPVSPEVKRLAAAALMVEAARRDNDFDDSERKAITSIVGEQFNLTTGDAKTLVELAEQRSRLPYGESIFTRTIAENFSDAERVDVVKMLWKVAMADGQLKRVEVAMIERLATEIGVSAKASADARNAVG